MTIVIDKKNGNNDPHAGGVWRGGRCPSSLDSLAGALARFGRMLAARRDLVHLSPSTREWVPPGGIIQESALWQRPSRAARHPRGVLHEAPCLLTTARCSC